MTCLATTASAGSPEQSTALARQALDRKLDGPPTGEERSAVPRLEIRQSGSELREQLIGLLPGETLEDVARTLANRQVEVRLSSDRAFFLVRVPLG
ncbi:hypothetical protein [Vulgatibacter sp.]|uniref:hypothetical protein n=1 Tax=Vulgatibacter sp. TaxID=1971226 RepID=UPI0035663F9A